MSFLFPLLMFVILFACVAMCFAEGMWSNAIRLVNLVTAGLLAMNFYEPIARWLEGMLPSFTFMLDYIVLWGLFAILVVILREVTAYVSQVKVRFLKIADRIGSIVLSVVIGCVMVAFTMAALHTAPLGRSFLYDGFKPEDKMLMSTAPDRQWLFFMGRAASGAFCRSDVRPFDAWTYMRKYATRRQLLEEHADKTQSLRVAN